MDFLCLDFINSRWLLVHKPFQERFEDPEWLSGFCAKWDLPLPGAEDIAGLIEFREFLFAAGSELCRTGELAPDKLDKLNARLNSVPLENRLECRDGSFHLTARSNAGGAKWMLYRIALSFAELVTGQPLEKLKQCGNPDCGEIFFDVSKNQTRKWCDNTCASLMKVRRFRADKKEASDAPAT